MWPTCSSRVWPGARTNLRCAPRSAGAARGLVGHCSLKESGRGSTSSRARGRLRGALVVAEISLALVLLVGAGLLVKNFQGLLNVNESYSPRTLLTMNVGLSDTRYPKDSTRLAFHEQVLERLSRLPGVESAAFVTHVPYSEGGGVGTYVFSIEGRPPAERGELRNAIIG